MTDHKEIFPIAEQFTSIQGEGLYVGVRMHFVRIAGCSVGRPIKQTDPLYNPELPVYTEICCLYDGRKFHCDTDFRARESKHITEILSQVPKGVRHLCITGGEPLNHDLTSLIDATRARGIKVHVETSGTVPISKGIPKDEEIERSLNSWSRIWITVSPKFKVIPEMIRRANEIKLLVDKDFSFDKLPMQVQEHPLVYLQPVNFEHSLNFENVDLCKALLEKKPTWRVSLQLHKILSVR